MTEAIHVRRLGLGLRVGIYFAVGAGAALLFLGRVPQAESSLWEWAGVVVCAAFAAVSLLGLRVDLVIDGDVVRVNNPLRAVTVDVADIDRVEVGFMVRQWAYVAVLVTRSGDRVVLWALSGWPTGLFTSSATTQMHAARFAALVDTEMVEN